MPERMSEGNPNEEESVDQASSGLEEEGDAAPRKPPNTGARLWDRVRSSLLRPKVTTCRVSCGQTHMGCCCKGWLGNPHLRTNLLLLSLVFRWCLKPCFCWD